jgi:SAM-dependent methyltransferase
VSASETSRPRVLDAGCGGQLRYFDIDDAYVVGIDVDQAALDRNTDADEKILGDIQSYPLPSASFDAVVCSDVIEHLPNPQAALANLFDAVRPGGRIHLAFPNRRAPKGVIARYTPLRFHVWVYRYLMGKKEAGTPGHAPYKTYLRPEMDPVAVITTARRHGLVVEDVDFQDGKMYTRFQRERPGLWRLMRLVWRHPQPSECRMTFVRP